MSGPKDSRKLIKIAKAHGWTVERRTNKWRLTSPTGITVMIPFSPSRSSTYQNKLSEMRRGGLRK